MESFAYNNELWSKLVRHQQNFARAPQHRAFGFLNSIEPCILMPNYYLDPYFTFKLVSCQGIQFYKVTALLEYIGSVCIKGVWSLQYSHTNKW